MSLLERTPLKIRARTPEQIERHKQRCRERYWANREERLAWFKTWRENNRELLRERGRWSYIDNRAKRLKQAAAYRKKNRALLRQKRREYYYRVQKPRAAGVPGIPPARKLTRHAEAE